MKVADIIAVIESIAPPEAAAPWDASGVQVASPKADAASLAVLLDPTLPALRKAADSGADFILAHHPLSMQPRFPNRADAYLDSLILLLSRGIWLYSAHTPLDASPDGPAHWLADELGLSDLTPLEAAAPPYGFGFSGLLPEAVPYDEFCRRLARLLGKGDWQVCGPKPASVRRVACCPGSGGGLLAAVAGADVYITGDIKYHTALDAESASLRVIDVGHFILEEEMMRRLAGRLAAELPVPVRFFPGRDPLASERPASA